MKQVLLVFLVCSLLLCACGKNLILPEAKNDYTIGIIGGADGPTAIIVGEQRDVLKDLPTKTHQGDGYVIEIPEKGWLYDKELDDGAVEESWTPVGNEHAELTIRTYALPLIESRRLCMEENEDYMCEDLMGETICGFDKEDGGMILWFRCFEDEGKTYYLSWEYSALASDNSAQIMSALSETFQLQ